MPRRDLTEERSAQILNAFERCVARLGLEGASLEKVAEEAGVKRSIIRHYIGNREDLVLALTERVAKKNQSDLESMRSYLVGTDTVEQLLDVLFPLNLGSAATEIMVFESLIAAAEKNTRIHEVMTQVVEDYVDCIADILQANYPKQDRLSCWSVANGVVSICFNFSSMAPLQLPDTHRQAGRECSRRLIETLAS